MGVIKMKKDFKIKRKSMRDEAYTILQNWIVIGELEPGRKLKDSELSEMLGISRTPVREALLRLEDEGLIETKDNRWTIVSEINMDQVEQIYPIVQSLEILAIEEGMINLNESVIKELIQINEDFKSELLAGEKINAYQLDLKFHVTIINLSGNSELLRILNNLKIKIKRIEVYYFDKKYDELESFIEHQKIITALKSGDIEEVKAAVWKNWENSFNRIKLKVNK